MTIRTDYQPREIIKSAEYNERGTRILAQDSACKIAQGTGIDPTGVADSTAAIQALIDELAAGSGGCLVFPPGTYLCATLTLKSKVRLLGAGVRASILKLKSGTNAPLLKGENFDALTGGSSTGGIHSWSLACLGLDGNSRTGNTSSHGLQFYGYGFDIDQVSIFNFKGKGYIGEWNGGSNSPGNDSMEARVRNMKVHDCESGGIYHNGPHDSYFENVISYLNGVLGAETGSTTIGIEVRANGGATKWVNCHAWGRNHRWAWKLVGGINCLINCEGEGAGDGAGTPLGGQALLIGNDTQIIGGHWFGARLVSSGGDGKGRGIQIGATAGDHADDVADQTTKGSNTAGTQIWTRAQNCELGAIRFRADGGEGSYNIDFYAAGAWPLVATDGTAPTSTNDLRLHLAGSAVIGGIGAAEKPYQHSSDLRVRGEGTSIFDGSVKFDNLGANQRIVVVNGSGTEIWNVNTNSNDIEFVNGADIIGFSDSYTTKKWEIDGGTGWFDMAEQAGPAAPAANFLRLFARDNGSGKTQLCVQFPTGSPIVVATEV